MAIKMGINKDQKSKCDECNVSWSNTKEMYNVLIAGKKHTLCIDCTYELFRKLLKANCMYNEKIKTKEDIARINRSCRKKGDV